MIAKHWGLLIGTSPVAIIPTDDRSMKGYPISAGVVEGPLKVLKYPLEKPVLPGDILVARCTNPGSSPL